MAYPTHEDETRQALIRQGICPDCGGSLDQAKLVRNTLLNLKERQCYNCLETFVIVEEE